MTTIISFVNQKGGVGKTTSVINIAAALAESEAVRKQNKRILILDMDPQGNSSQIYATITDKDLSIYNLLIQQGQYNPENKKVNIKALTQTTYIENLDILPSNVLLSSAELDLVNTHARETTLKRILKEDTDFINQYEYILIDCQPSLGLLTVNSIVASDFIVIPLKADVFSLTGVELLTNTVEKLQKIFEIDTTIAGFFFTEVNQNESMFKESYDLCKQNYGKLLFNSVIRDSVTIDHANAMGQSIVNFDSAGGAALDYVALSKELVKKTKESYLVSA
jgi:chromosome partitioning protein